MNSSNCSFCNKSQSEVSHLMAKANIAICNECVAVKQKDCEDPEKYVEYKQHEKCSFCSFMTSMQKLPKFIRQFLPEPSPAVRVVGGPHIWICKQCLDLCDEIIVEKRKSNPAPSSAAWRKLGFFYDFDEESNVQRIFGDKTGIRAFIAELVSYGNSKYHQHIGAHDHLGPYMYLELRTCSCTGIDEGLIHGMPKDFLTLADLIEKELSTHSSTTIVIKDFGTTNSIPLCITVSPDGFDPSSMDRFIASGD